MIGIRTPSSTLTLFTLERPRQGTTLERLDMTLFGWKGSWSVSLEGCDASTPAAVPAERALLSGRVAPRPSDSHTMPHRFAAHTSSSALPGTQTQRITCSLSNSVLCLERRDHCAQERGIGHCFAAEGNGLLHCRENTGDEGFLHSRFLSHDGEDFIGDVVRAETVLEGLHQVLRGSVLRHRRSRRCRNRASAEGQLNSLPYLPPYL